MSLGVYPVFERELIGTEFQALGEILVSNFQALDAIAWSAELTPFTAFADNRLIPEDFDGDPDELAEIMGERVDWFDAAAGRAAVRALIKQIKSDRKSAEQLSDAEGVVTELEELGRVLAAAEAQGIEFRLEMS